MVYQSLSGKVTGGTRNYARGAACMHCPKPVVEACSEIEHGYRRSPGHAMELLSGLAHYESLIGWSARDLRGVVCEAIFVGRFDWLRDEKGWDVHYPIVETYTGEAYKLLPQTPGKRVEARRHPNNDSVAEFDCVAKIENHWTLGEAKLAGQFHPKDARRKVGAFMETGIVAAEEVPAFVLGVPEDHPINRGQGYGKRRFEESGGKVLVFRGVTSHYIGMLAGDLAQRMKSREHPE